MSQGDVWRHGKQLIRTLSVEGCSRRLHEQPPPSRKLGDGLHQIALAIHAERAHCLDEFWMAHAGPKIGPAVRLLLNIHELLPLSRRKRPFRRRLEGGKIE